jgi:polyhydroxyalkanoate synthesis repressor PhaR
MANPRLIRKYVNRRLYDTSQSRYVNLDDLRKLIVDGAALRVVDQSNGDDITTSVLLQIIGDAQRAGATLFNAEFLSDLVRLSAKDNDPTLPDRLNNALRDALTRTSNAGVISVGTLA